MITAQTGPLVWAFIEPFCEYITSIKKGRWYVSTRKCNMDIKDVTSVNNYVA